jgi:hypothetical protein
MALSNIDTLIEYSILTPEEVAEFLHKSVSWVYKHSEELGGRKLGGSLFFPRKEELYEHLFPKREGMEVRFHPDSKQVHRCRIQNKNSGKKSNGQKKGGNKQSENRDNPNRHGLLETG